MLTRKQYLKCKGLYCPICEGDEVKIDGPLEHGDSNDLFQSVRCGDCGATWIDHYGLTGYAELRSKEE